MKIAQPETCFSHGDQKQKKLYALRRQTDKKWKYVFFFSQKPT